MGRKKSKQRGDKLQTITGGSRIMGYNYAHINYSIKLMLTVNSIFTDNCTYCSY